MFEKVKRKFSAGIEFIKSTMSGGGGDDDDLMGLLMEKYEEAFEVVREYADEWRDNRRAYLAKGQDMLGGDAGLWSEDADPAIQTSGLVADKIDDMVAIQLQNRPKVYPFPKTYPDWQPELGPQQNMTPGSYNRKVWEKCIEDFDERAAIKRKLIEVCKDARLCGHSVTAQEITFNHEIGDLDACMRTIQPENFGLDPDAKGIADARWTFEKTYWTFYKAKKMWPKHKDDLEKCLNGQPRDSENENNIPRGSTEKENTKHTGKILVVIAYFRDETTEVETTTETKTDPETGLLIQETIKRDVLKYPTGRRIAFLPETRTKLEDGKNKYADFPYAMYVPCPISWSARGRNQATPIRSLQHLDDRVTQQGYKTMQVVGNVFIMARRGSITDPEAMTGGTCKIVEYEGGPGQVYFSAPQNILGDTLAMRNSIRQDADNISGVYAPAQGNPASLTSGRAVHLLQQASNRKMQPEQDMFAEFLQRAYKQICDNMKVTYKAGRPLRVSDDDRIPDTLEFDLSESTSTIDVRVDSDQRFPVDPVSRFNMLSTVMQMTDEFGMPLIGWKTFLQHMDFPGIDDVEKEKMSALAYRDLMKNAQMQGSRGVMATRSPGQTNPSPEMTQGPDNRQADRTGMAGMQPNMGGLQM